MKCPTCGNARTSVTCTIPMDDAIRRQRKCPACKATWQTTEISRTAVAQHVGAVYTDLRPVVERLNRANEWLRPPAFARAFPVIRDVRQLLADSITALQIEAPLR